MALEQFKTQVLLLHSEQSTLDRLSSGFNDRYTVHCATSGSEALTTLGQTPIHVIVTAQHLPGMSGLDALREAKKRSPDTIGILLAGDKDDGLEALVGDQEVFQVVRGGVTSDSLRALIDNATRQVRMLALAESANDTAANVDEPMAEHIVMETAENGSAIISNGTGRMPMLDPKKVSPDTSVGSRSVDILVLTKDEEFLATIKDSSRGLHNVHYANSVAQADEVLRNHKVGVAVVDAAVVGSNVEKLTMHLRTTVPRLVAIVAGRRDDGEMLMDLINRSKVYRFLLKPVSPGRARLAVEASVKHHLEAPDAVFINAGPSAPAKAPAPATPQPKPTPAARSVAQAKAAPQSIVQSKPQPKPRSEPQVTPEAKPAARPLPVIEVSGATDRLSNSLDGDDADSHRTMTGIVKTVGESFASIKGTLAKTPDTATPESSSDGSGGSLFKRTKMLGIGAATLLVLASLGFWILGGSNEPVTSEEPLAGTPSISEADVVFESPAPVDTGVASDELLDKARRASVAGQIYDPPGNNAIELYMAASDAAPDDAVIALELDAVILQALADAESALLEHRAVNAEAALQRVALADPDNPRLPFLTAQFAQMQLRSILGDARVAIRESRYEDAAIALSAARALGVADLTEIDLVDAELGDARSEQQVDDVLAKAASRLEELKLTAPSNDNARYYYELVLSNDPENTAALQGLSAIASQLVLQARTQIDRGNFNTAEALLADAGKLDPSSSALAESTTVLVAAREREARALSDEAERQAELERQAAEQRAAEQLAAEQRAADQRAEAIRIAAEEQATIQTTADVTTQGTNDTSTTTTSDEVASESVDDTGDPGDIAAAAVAPATTEQTAAAQRADAAAEEADTTTSDEVASESVDDTGDPGDIAAAAVAPATTEPPAIDTDTPAADNTAAEVFAGPPIQESTAQPAVYPTPVTLRSLTRTKYVAPKYPRAAERRSISGWVDVIFTVDTDGQVKDITVRDSRPGETFVNAATKAVEGWKFEPIVENGLVVEKRAAVRMMFAIE